MEWKKARRAVNINTTTTSVAIAAAMTTAIATLAQGAMDAITTSFHSDTGSNTTGTTLEATEDSTADDKKKAATDDSSSIDDFDNAASVDGDSTAAAMMEVSYFKLERHKDFSNGDTNLCNV